MASRQASVLASRQASVMTEGGQGEDEKNEDGENGEAIPEEEEEVLPPPCKSHLLLIELLYAND